MLRAATPIGDVVYQGSFMQAERKRSFASVMADSFQFNDGKLPSLPNAVVYLEKAMRDDSVGLSELSELLSKDPVLAARLVRVSNSAYYRAMSPAETVPAAVTRIGFKATRNIALGLLQNSFVARNDVIAAMISELWMESLRTAAVAQALAAHYTLMDSQKALLGGLMYNVGPMLLLTKIDDNTDSIERADAHRLIDMHAVEFGVMLLEYWEMDTEMIEVAANRNHWTRDHGGAPDLADLVLVARSCIPDLEGRRPDFQQCENLPSYQRMKNYLRLTESLESIVDDAEESIAQTLDMFF